MRASSPVDGTGPFARAGYHHIPRAIPKSKVWTVSRLDQIEGRHPVLEAIRAGRRVRKLFLFEGARGSALEVEQAARRAGIPVVSATRAELDAMVHGRVHQGVVALAEPRTYQSVEDILTLAGRRGEAPFLVLLDGVEDPRNLGSIIRTSAAAGVHGLIIPSRRSADLTPAAVKTSAGAADHLAIARVVNLARTLDDLKERGLWIVGADAEAAEAHTQLDLNGPLALVIGGEHQGLRRLVREKCDFLARIPMAGPLNSLNASVAAAILIFEAVRQRAAPAQT